jgi:predicted HicB family RNase H-like nuclease
MSVHEKQAEVERAAAYLFELHPDWVTFYRQILGVGGVMRRNYPTREALAQFEQTEAYREIQRMMAVLRKRKAMPEDAAEPTQVITLRLPKSLHESIRVEAYEHHTSMNRLCISKLLQLIDAERIPSEIS